MARSNRSSNGRPTAERRSSGFHEREGLAARLATFEASTICVDDGDVARTHVTRPLSTKLAEVRARLRELDALVSDWSFSWPAAGGSTQPPAAIPTHATPLPASL